MAYDNESEFEKDLVNLLSTQKGWDGKMLEYPTEEELLQNWKDILFRINRGIDQLNDVPLSDSEMQQILEIIASYRTPYQLNKNFINSGYITIKRDNPEDQLHYGKEISLKIYNRKEIALGHSYYQIARQPKFKARKDVFPERRGDVMLLINGMPVIHIELKKSGVAISQAAEQIRKYVHEGIFSGIFSLVQIFVAMNPEETVYFANPGSEDKFNQKFFFHWADKENNERINDWKDIAEHLLSIPMAHQLIGFYSVADAKDASLKVLRSYQIYAIWAIDDKISKINWEENNHQKGGYVWHTTGSGKTLTSFKTAQLISEKDSVDKVVFLLDRIELGLQTIDEYQNFADDATEIQGTENTHILMQKLISNAKKDRLIVTSIQKFSILASDSTSVVKEAVNKINRKRIVCIIDEAHRSVFGEMLMNIKGAFNNMVFVGFTGTPIFDQNMVKGCTTEDIFGDNLHTYSLASGIIDGNVLGFDPTMVETYKEKDLREAVALDIVKANTSEEAMQDVKRREKYFKVIDEYPMAGYKKENGEWVDGIEDNLPVGQYTREEHQVAVVKDIQENWYHLSKYNKFHALFATSSINEAIAYYRLFKKLAPDIKVTALFDKNIDNNEDAIFKEDGLIEILDDYNARYGKTYTLSDHSRFKADIGYRLSHKGQYISIENDNSQKIDILIVVDQMLTGFDSKWINTLYLDKELKYQSIIQAFSRTNRVFGNDKQFGSIRYYRKPHTMKQNIDLAVKTYCEDRPSNLFVPKLKANLLAMNALYEEIKCLFIASDIKNFEKLPNEMAFKQKFAKLFHEFHAYLEAALIQGFLWEKRVIEFIEEDGKKSIVEIEINNHIYATLLARYKELFQSTNPNKQPKINYDCPYEIDTYITAIKTGHIDAEYMNAYFRKYMHARQNNEDTMQIRNELHRTFAALPQDEQQYAMNFLHDVESSIVIVDETKTLKEYIIMYKVRATNDCISEFANDAGVNVDMLRELIKQNPTSVNIDEGQKVQNLMKSVDINKAKKYLEEKLGYQTLEDYRAKMKIEEIIRNFIFEMVNDKTL